MKIKNSSILMLMLWYNVAKNTYEWIRREETRERSLRYSFIINKTILYLFSILLLVFLYKIFLNTNFAITSYEFLRKKMNNHSVIFNMTDTGKGVSEDFMIAFFLDTIKLYRQIKFECWPQEKKNKNKSFRFTSCRRRLKVSIQ